VTPVVLITKVSMILTLVTFLDNLVLFFNNNSPIFLIEEKGEKIKKTVSLPTGGYMC